MVGEFHKPVAGTRHPRRILAQLGVEPARASIGVQPVDIGTTTMSIEPRRPEIWNEHIYM